MGGLPVGPGRVNRLKCPDSWVWVVRPPSLGGSIIVSHSKAWAMAVHPLLTGGLLTENSTKVVPSTFRVAGSPLVGGSWLQPAAPVGGLAVANRPLAGGLGRSRLPLVASHSQPLLLTVIAANELNDSTRFNLITWRSYIPVFQIRMEKMKEVKRPPLSRYPHDGSLQRNSSNLISQLLRRGREENRRRGRPKL
ncbi:hypothetical protein GW17_00039035 [Ensete ventricosum]|nr:hypothetical protein GW17_00039035 [Ensete ventricosum]